MLVSLAHTNRTRDTRVAEPRPPVPEDGRQGEKQRLTPEAPRNCGRPPPPGTAPRHPRGAQPHTGHASQADSAGPPHPHTRADSTRVAGPDSRPRGRQPGREKRLNSDAPHNGGRHPGTAFRRPHSTQQRLARAPRYGAGAGTVTTPAACSPAGHAGEGDSVGPPHPNTGAHSMWVADPGTPPGGGLRFEV